MRTTLRRTTALLFLLLLAAGQQAPAQELATAQQPLLSAGPFAPMEAWEAAFNAHDVEGLMSLVAPDALAWGTNNGNFLNTEAAIRRYYSGMFNTGNQVELIGYNVLQTGENSAVVAGNYVFSLPAPGNYVESYEARFLFAFERIRDAWRIVGIHSSLTPGPEFVFNSPALTCSSCGPGGTRP